MVLHAESSVWSIAAVLVSSECCRLYVSSGIYVVKCVPASQLCVIECYRVEFDDVSSLSEEYLQWQYGWETKSCTVAWSGS